MRITRLELVHRSNAAELMAIVDAHGWPGRALVVDARRRGKAHRGALDGRAPRDATGAALVEQAANMGEVPSWHAAHLVDRVRVFEGQPQRYGTQLDGDDQGALGRGRAGRARRGGCLARGARLAAARRPARACEGEGSGSYPGRESVEAGRRELAAWAKRTGWRGLGRSRERAALAQRTRWARAEALAARPPSRGGEYHVARPKTEVHVLRRRWRSQRAHLSQASLEDAPLAVVADQLQRAHQAALGRLEIAQSAREVGAGRIQQVPPRVRRPKWQQSRAMIAPNTGVFTSPIR
jgi:hypothetical protein